MKTSRDRILTTHVGSLPRTEAVVDLLERTENGARGRCRRIRSSGTGARRRYASGGRSRSASMSSATARRARSATRPMSRTGFPDLPMHRTRSRRSRISMCGPFPISSARWRCSPDSGAFKRVACIGPVAVRRPRAARARIWRTCARRSDAAKPVDAFMNAASPGVVASFLPNRYYPSHEAYIAAVADAMREEYEAIVEAGFVLQIDCPDLAMSRHTAFQDLSEAEFLQARAVSRRGAQPRAGRHSGRTRCASMSAGATTRARTPTTSISRKIVGHHPERQGAGDFAGGGQSAP